MTRTIPKKLLSKLWTVSVGDFPTSALAPAGSEPRSQIRASDHPKNLVLEGNQDLRLVVLWRGGADVPKKPEVLVGRRLAVWGVSCPRGVLEGGRAAVEGCSGSCWLML